MLSSVVFVVVAAIVLISAVWVVTLRNLFRAALSLGLVLLGVAGLFILIGAEFLAFVQILVYVGAILTLVIFAIMLTARLQTDLSISGGRQVVPAAIASLSCFILLVVTTHMLSWPVTPMAEPATVADLGQRLVKELVLPFEVISLVFLAVMVGSIALAAPRASRDRNRASSP